MWIYDKLKKSKVEYTCMNLFIKICKILVNCSICNNICKLTV